MRTRGLGNTVCVAGLAALIFGATGAAYGAAPPSLSACEGLAAEARLACYDRVIAAAHAEGADAVAIDHEHTKELSRKSFGLSRSAMVKRERPSRPEPVNHLTVELASAKQDDGGDWVMTTTEGAVWRQVNDDRPYNPPRPGSKVAIKPALFGAYFCTVDGQPAIRCTRDQ